MAEARPYPGGWVYEIDGAKGDDPHGEVPPTAIAGAWEVDSGGALTGVYQAHPNYGADGPRPAHG
ncbi:hypothetical protein [Streptomyces sp. CMB-StM0423]|uniref:hypothetical protein n=1 Tax=Streptomyces sp. CMB-StM0423 TaxID=2059884 RepID=UPI00131C2908|nr:hypothetical protein [Streptomyces sp. CMB-StM0423]